MDTDRRGLVLALLLFLDVWAGLATGHVWVLVPGPLLFAAAVAGPGAEHVDRVMPTRRVSIAITGLVTLDFVVSILRHRFPGSADGWLLLDVATAGALVVAVWTILWRALHHRPSWWKRMLYVPCIAVFHVALLVLVGVSAAADGEASGKLQVPLAFFLAASLSVAIALPYLGASMASLGVGGLWGWNAEGEDEPAAPHKPL